MIQDMAAYPYRFWLIFGGLLLAAELLGTYGYLLWSGVSAIIIGAVTWIVPMDWSWQWVNFAILTMVTAIIWWYWLKTRTVSENQHLNQPDKLLIGRKMVLSSPIINGAGRINLADGSWPVRCSEDLPQGTEIRIVAVESITLIVEAIRDEHRNQTSNDI
ncbi:NfeD family protein [Budviciaceae bacterium CWB-B4]|uniref:NfeD family protein n=1 Tax=Limnobaculum xujianqingii TaxID=2738837 RepID=A0A9D7FRQ5_9GAMM|nr:NfeD family protein [Limnobaculum xujianqingii]MBK5072344.1 NfeD family protein [Limnobaculum xujianqingii]MBK5175653.1 NfeD family protein [Limnobaculum xujianqingii]